MEQDYVFRSGTINPTLEENYLPNKWKSITEKLNCTGNGPQLSVEEWKRRFKDWKNSTRAKYRKIQESRNATGGGPQIDTKLTPLEERGLFVWGRVTVAGFVGVEEGGLPRTSSEIPISDATVSDLNSVQIDIVDFPTEMEHQVEELKNISHIDMTPKRNVKTRSGSSNSKRPQPLNEIGMNLLDAYNNSIKNNEDVVTAIEKFTSTYKEIESEKLKLEKRKFDFEMKKYKYENSGFDINENIYKDC